MFYSFSFFFNIYWTLHNSAFRKNIKILHNNKSTTKSVENVYGFVAVEERQVSFVFLKCCADLGGVCCVPFRDTGGLCCSWASPSSC